MGMCPSLGPLENSHRPVEKTVSAHVEMDATEEGDHGVRRALFSAWVDGDGLGEDDRRATRKKHMGRDGLSRGKMWVMEFQGVKQPG